MASEADFTEEEWEPLQRGPTGTGMLVSVADPGLMDSFGEPSALAKYLESQRLAGATELMRELGGTHGTGFGLTTKPDEVRAGTILALQPALAIAAQEPLEMLSPEPVLGRGGGDGRLVRDDLEDGHPVLRHATDCRLCPDSPVAYHLSPMS